MVVVGGHCGEGLLSPVPRLNSPSCTWTASAPGQQRLHRHRRAGGRWNVLPVVIKQLAFQKN